MGRSSHERVRPTQVAPPSSVQRERAGLEDGGHGRQEQLRHEADDDQREEQQHQG
jgi:hypothetical protein